MAAFCKDCGIEIVWALTKSGSKIPIEIASEKRYVRVDSADFDPVVSLRDTYKQHECNNKA